MPSRATILLVEDNDDDAELATMAFREANIQNPIQRAKDGAEALDCLLGGADAGGATPDLPVVVLLDLQLPRVGGLEVLEAIRNDPRTQLLPVVILTSSAEERDRLAAYRKHANSFVQKPVNYDSFVEAARQLGRYWVALNQVPPEPT